MKWISPGVNLRALHCAEMSNRSWLDGNETLRAAIAADVGTVNTEGNSRGAEDQCHHDEFRNDFVKAPSVRSRIGGNDNCVYHNTFNGMTIAPPKRRSWWRG